VRGGIPTGIQHFWAGENTASQLYSALCLAKCYNQKRFVDTKCIKKRLVTGLCLGCKGNLQHTRDRQLDLRAPGRDKGPPPPIHGSATAYVTDIAQVIVNGCETRNKHSTDVAIRSFRLSHPHCITSSLVTALCSIQLKVLPK